MTIELVWNKSDCTVKLKGIAIHAAPREYPPFTYQAMLEEQDTNLLLTEQSILNDPGKPAWYLANTLENGASYPLGTVITKGQNPKRLLAIVHDIERTPTCKPSTVQRVWQNVMRAIEDNQISSAAMPLLGSVYGKLSITDSISLFRECLHKNTPTCLEKIWLILPENCSCESLAQLNDTR